MIICLTHNEINAINDESLKLIDGSEQKFVAMDTDSNVQPLREADQIRLQQDSTRLPDRYNCS